MKIQANISASPAEGSSSRHFVLLLCVVLIVTNLVDVIRAFESDEYDEDYGRLEDSKNTTQSHEWDVLIFTQQWPLTTCYQWKEEDKDNKCNLPPKKDAWTIHGIWPTKLHTLGPNFCNKTAKFDVDKLEPIVDELFVVWPDIEIDKKEDYDYLWQHEWMKHGTCAAEIEQLNDELKYFEQGLNWHSGFFMSDILAKAGIYPDSDNTVIGLHTALVKVLGKNPSIHCLYDNKNDISYLSEIRICFDKSFQLIDCDGVRFDRIAIDYPGGQVNTNCHVSQPIHYPSSIPPVDKHRQRPKDTWKFPIVNVYKLVQFLLWCTL